MVLVQGLESFRATLFRQALFAEFEMLAFELAESGKPLTTESLGEIYVGLYKKYYGPACVIDPLIAAEVWRIPHFFHHPFYVWVYCVGMSCARVLKRQLLSEGEPARLRILNNFLRAGGTKDPVDILKDAGADPSTRHPIDTAMAEFTSLTDMLEEVMS
jgi:oligoendopeptidase F